jgi:hypothetical protein
MKYRAAERKRSTLYINDKKPFQIKMKTTIKYDTKKQREKPIKTTDTIRFPRYFFTENRFPPNPTNSLSRNPNDFPPSY